MTSLKTPGGDWSYENLICHALLLPMGELPLSERIWGKDKFEGGVTGRRGGSGGCGQGVK